MRRRGSGHILSVRYLRARSADEYAQTYASARAYDERESTARRRWWAEVERKCHAHERARSFVRSGDDRPIGRIGEGLSEGEGETFVYALSKITK